jgi:polyketide synthase 12
VETAGDDGARGLAALLAGLPADEAETAALDWLRDQVALVLGHPSGGSVDADQAFTQLGFDSLTSVELCNRLSSRTGLRLPTTLVFSYPTPRELSGHLVGLLRPEPDLGADIEVGELIEVEELSDLDLEALVDMALDEKR